MPYVQGRFQSPIYYETIGKGLPIVFIHPPGMGLITFEKQRDLAKHFQLIFFDIRGNGRSGAGSEQITMSLLAEDIARILDELNIRKAVIFGYSNGGSIAQEFALSHPERTMAVIMSGPFPEVNSFILRTEFRLGLLVSRLKRISFLAKALAFAHTKNYETAFREKMANYFAHGDPNIVYQLYKEGLHYRSTNRLQEIHAPVLVIYAKFDFYLHHYSKMFIQRLADIELVTVDKATHQIPTKNAPELNRIIVDFINRRLSPITGVD
ncbi:alpha/beta fold hydrolase [Alkalihalobacillus sp. BA299]|uniref:alpha/beta fold hydrolase n=1 Tax=Alkalihalobacillus sp. BA299 TaxID=2815938 RepID=UPI001ADA0274|nr:alpha/beta hydrolase [Alkalihalobacillus sp. BA299]